MEREPLTTELIADDVEGVRAAIEAGTVTIARRFLNRRTLLHQALTVKAERIARFLIQRGADVNARNRWGMGALSEAARCGCVGVLRLLVERGADVNEQDDLGLTPLQHALLGREPETRRILTTLRQLGADVDLSNKKGESARVWLKRSWDHASLLEGLD